MACEKAKELSVIAFLNKICPLNGFDFLVRAADQRFTKFRRRTLTKVVPVIAFRTPGSRPTFIANKGDE